MDLFPNPKVVLRHACECMKCATKANYGHGIMFIWSLKNDASAFFLPKICNEIASSCQSATYKVVFCPRSLLLGFVKACIIQKRRLVHYFCSLLDNALPVFVLYKHWGGQIVLTEMKRKMPKCKFSTQVYQIKKLSYYWNFMRF